MVATQKKVMVIDSDAHVVESERTWDYLEGDDRKYRPMLLNVPGDPALNRPGRRAWFIDGKTRGFAGGNLSAEELEQASQRRGRDLRTNQAAREMGDVDMRLKHMDRLGIDVQVLYATIFIEQLTDRPAIDVALCRSWNRWLGDIWQKADGRLRWVCQPPLLSIPDAIDEVRWAKDHGAVAVAIRPYEADKILTDPTFYPVLAEAERLNMAIGTHIANANPLMVDMIRRQYGPADLATAAYMLYHVPAVVACQALLNSPISELFPTLRWGFIEANSMWVPFVARDTSERYRQRGQPWPEENIFKAMRVYVTCENDDDLPMVMQYIHPDNLLIGTDYGHTDPSSNVSAIHEFSQKEEISQEIKEKILSHNPKAFHAL